MDGDDAACAKQMSAKDSLKPRGGGKECVWGAQLQPWFLSNLLPVFTGRMQLEETQIVSSVLAAQFRHHFNAVLARLTCDVPNDNVRRLL